MGEIKVGSVVQLRSGGPKMTVGEINRGEDGVSRAWCQWFEDKKTQANSFAIHTLKLDE
jgi:uncharacterized protein YodC (DUF2158 family)